MAETNNNGMNSQGQAGAQTQTGQNYVKRDPNEVKWKDRKHWLWFPWSFTKYEVRNERLYVQSGFFKTNYDETLLYRITDIKLQRTFGQKICGTGSILIFTKADSNHVIELKNIKKSVQVKDYLSELIETIRDQKHIIGKEFYGGVIGGNGPMHDMDGDGVDDCLQGGPPPFM